MKHLPLSAVVTFVLLFVSLNAFSQDISQRTRNAELVFEGKITKKTSFWNSAKTRIFTANEITVSRSFKGDVPQTIEIVTHGGEVDGVQYHIEHTMPMPINGEGVFFCKHFDNSPNQADRFLMLNGQSGVIYYETRTTGFQAKDNMGVYKNLKTGVLDKIIEAIGSDPIVYGKNVFENNFSDWLYDNIGLFSMNDTIIEFSFDNIQLIGTTVTEVEFDILVKSNIAGIKFVATDIFLEYSTEAFGEYVVQNEMISASKRTVIEDTIYTFDLVDYSENTLQLLVTSNFQAASLYPLSQTFEEFLHVTLNIENIYALANISFDDFLMADQSLFYDENTGEFVEFDRIIVSPPFNPFDVPDVLDFFGEDALNPHHITAGTEEILTIIGTGFLGVKGIIEFYDADNPSGVTVVETSENDIISWNDVEIKVKVPSADADFSGHTAGTGFFKVVLPSGGGDASSDDPLYVDYSVYNFRTTPGNSVPVHLGDAEVGDGNDNGELVFTLSNNMDVVAFARDIVEAGICDWNSKTNVNWDLDPMPATNATAANGDNKNLIYFGGESEFTGSLSSLKAYTILRLGTNDRRIPCTGLGYVFQREVDIVFREGSNLSNANSTITGWHYTSLATPTNPATDEFDFYTTILHELGHAHLLRHVREHPKIMNNSISSGNGAYVNRTFQPEDVEGGEFVLAKSETVYNLGGGCLEEHHTTFVNTMGICGMIDKTREISGQEYPVRYHHNNGELVFSFPEMGYAGHYHFVLYSVDGRQIQSNEFDINAGEIEKSINLTGIPISGFFVFELANSETHERLSGKLILTH